MAERTGLEPATSGVTGQHSNQLNYRSALKLCRCPVYPKTPWKPSPMNTFFKVFSQGLKKSAMAERTGLEPATSGVTGQHSNQLNYRSVLAKPFAFFPNLPGRRQGPRLQVGGLDVVAERTGLEPATSGVTGQHSNQLNYRSTLKHLPRCCGGC